MITSVNVHIGEVKFARNGHELHTILGSCIGIGLLWHKRSTYGLAHCLLPSSPNNDFDLGARFVDQAIHSLLELMDITNVRDVRAVIAGGANMTNPDCEHPEKLIGYQNAQSAIQHMDRMKIRILHEDTGGFEGRKMSICCSTGTFTVRSIPRAGN